MNRLSTEKRATILNLLVEGMSMRAVSRTTGVSINTVTKLLVDAGEACAEFHDDAVRGVRSRRVQCDEIWSFCYAKKKNVLHAKAAPEGAGDVWTWTAIDADTKLIIAYEVGDRSGATAHEFMNDIRQVQGDPDPDHISTSYVERQNLTMRMGMRRFTRLTNAFSKKLENHLHMLSLYFVHYNFCRLHKTLRVTPAMAAGLSDTLHDMEWIVGLLDARAPAPNRPKTYRKRA